MSRENEWIFQKILKTIENETWTDSQAIVDKEDKLRFHAQINSVIFLNLKVVSGRVL